MIIDPAGKVPTLDKSDQDRLNWAFKTASRTPGTYIDLRGKDHWIFDKPLVSSFIGGGIIGNGVFSQLEYTGTGFAFILDNCKDAIFERIGLILTPGASGWRFGASGSAGRCKLANLHVQGGQIGFLWQEDGDKGGSDNWLIGQVFTNGANTGFRIVGHNSVAPWIFDGCTASGANLGFDLSEGGTGASFRQCGGSDTITMWHVSGGQSGRIEDAVTERVGTVLLLGESSGDTPYTFHAGDLRDTRKAIARIVKCGAVSVDVDRFSGASLIEAEARGGQLKVVTSLPVKAIGDVVCEE